METVTVSGEVLVSDAGLEGTPVNITKKGTLNAMKLQA